MAGELNENEAAMLKAYGDQESVSIATGTQLPIGKAPAVTTVITAADIKAIGATDLDEVLETVPGLHVIPSSTGYSPIYTFRGIYSNNSPQVLLLINGISITNLYAGDRNKHWGGMPVQAIARIEVVRGPGSAVYGADAFAGVINIITKTKRDINGTQVGGRVGSFDTYDGWALHGDTWAGFDVAAMFEYHDTDGPHSIIDADGQTAFDQRFGTHASLAPGPVSLQRRNIDARLDLSREHWRFRAGLQSRGNRGNGINPSQVLDPYNRTSSDRWNADLSYDNPQFAEYWDVKAQASYFDTAQEQESNLHLYPAGAALPIGANGQIGPGPLIAFPQGYIANPEIFERHARINASAIYTGFERHTLRMGAGFNYGTLYKANLSLNYGINPYTGQPIPQASQPFSVIDVSDTSSTFIRTAERKNFFALLQDEWRFSRDWSLTTGVRFDNYSDFGNTFNPRTALVWETRHDLTTKLMYGSAFRPPAFSELYFVNSPVALGNTDLKPETLDTLELAFDYQPHDKLRLGLGLFNYWWADMIRFTRDPGIVPPTYTAKNVGTQDGYGSEWEFEWKANERFKLLGNYAYQQSTNETYNHNAGYAPRHQIYLRANWEFLPDWHFTPQTKWILDRSRPDTDSRPATADYAWVDLTLRRQRLADHWEAAFSVRNLFDVDAREPSAAGNQKASIPYDLPLAGRSFYGEIRYNF
jgi:iron complex outermembrane receptor protein